MRLPSLISAFLLPCVSLWAQTSPPPDAVARRGMPNFLSRCAQDGQSLRVAYFGGSITAANGWRVQTLQEFRKRWPKAQFAEINAAIGGTGSDLGVFRCDHDVVSQKPDLVFVEFAVNDGGADPARIEKGMEGIVRQIWSALPSCDICFVYTIAGNMLDDYKAGRVPRSVQTMERVADHYAIPSINFGPEIARREAAGQLIFKAPGTSQDGKPVFSNDGVHPHPDTGHVVYTDLVRKAVEEWSAKPAASPAKLGEPLRPDHWQAARTVEVKETWLKGGWRKLDAATDNLAKSFSSRLPVLFEASEAGATLEFAFDGTMIGVFDLLGPDGGQVRVRIDGQDKGLRPRFDSYCTYQRLASLWLAEDLPPGRHTVRLELTAEPIDKAAILAKRNEKIDDPARFAPLRWHPGSILVVGQLE